MACKYEVPGFSEDKRRDPILDHIDNTPTSKRDLNFVVKSLIDSEVLRAPKGKILVHNGSFFSAGEYSLASTVQAREKNLEVLKGINATVGELFTFKDTKKWTYNTPLRYDVETYEVQINKDLFQNTPAGFAIDQDSPSAMQNKKTGQFRLFDQRSPIKSGESIQLDALEDIGNDFIEAFALAGITVEIVLNPDLNIYGRVVPISDTEAQIELHPNIATRETLFHETGHVFVDLLDMSSLEVQGALNELRGGEIDALVQELYPDLTGVRYDKELLATYLGLGGAEYKAVRPNALQRFINKILEFLGIRLGKSPQEAAKILDRFMGMQYADLEGGVIDEAVQEHRASKMGTPKTKVEESRKTKGSKISHHSTVTPSEFAQDIIDDINTRIQTLEKKGGIATKANREQRGQELELLDGLKAQLANLESAQEFSNFVTLARRRVGVMKSKMTRLIGQWPELGEETMSQKMQEQSIGRLVSIIDEIGFYYHSDFSNSTLHTISRFVDTQIGKYEKSRNKEALKNPIYKELGRMQTNLEYIIPELQKLNEDVYYTGLQYQADWLLGFHDKNIDPQVAEIIKKIEATKKWRGAGLPLGLRRKDPRFVELQSQKDKMSKEEYKDAVLKLAIEHIKEKLPNRNTIVEMLRTAYKDKSAYSYWVDPHIYSSWIPAQLFQKGVQTHITNATEKTRVEVFKIGAAREAYQKATGKLDITPEKFNEALIETVAYWVVNPSTDESVKMNLLTFVQPFLVNEYNTGKRAFYEKLNKDTNKPKYDPSDPEAFIEWLKEEGETYFNSELTWWKENTDRIIDENGVDISQQTLDKLATEYNKVFSEVLKAQAQKRSKKRRGKVLTEASMSYLEQDIASKIIILDQLEKDIRRMVVFNEKGGTSAFIQKYNNNKYDKSKIVFKGQLAKPKASKYANPKYTRIQNTPALKEAHDFLLGIMKKKQKDSLGYKTPMRKNLWEDFSYMVPVVRNSAKNRLLEEGFWAPFKDAVKDGTQGQATDTNYGVLIDTNGDPLQSVAMFFVNPTDAKNVSKDVWESVALFAHMANMNESLGKVADVATMQLTLMENMSVGKHKAGIPLLNNRKKRRGEIEQVTIPDARDTYMYKATKEFIDSIILGQRDIKAQFQLFGRTFDGGKIASNIAQYTALNTLSFNMLQASNQFLLDNFQSFNEAVAGEYYDKSDLLWAKRKYWAAAGALGDISEFAQKTKLGQAMTMFDALVETTGSPEAMGGANIKKVLSRNNLMFVQKGVEHELQGVRMLAMMHRKKGFKNKDGETIYVEKGSRKLTTTNTGEEANLWDVLTKNDQGLLRVDRMVANFNNKDIAAMTLKLRGVSRMTNQIKGVMDRSRYQRRWWGKLVGLFRNWMPPGIRRRFGHGDGIHIDEEIGRATEGMYVSFARYLVDVITTHGALANLPESWNSRTEMEKANIKRTGLEVSFGVMMMALSTLLLSMVGDDDDTPATSFALYQMRRLQSEMFVYMSLGEAYRMIKSPTPTARPIGKILELLSHLVFTEIPYAVGLPVDEKDIFYQRKSGMFEKGDRKLNKKLIQSFPVGPGLLKSFNAKEAVEYFERSPFSQ
jgi:hypothetical protein